MVQADLAAIACGTDSLSLTDPSGVAVYNGRLIVAESSGRVLIFAFNGTSLSNDNHHVSESENSPHPEKMRVSFMLDQLIFLQEGLAGLAIDSQGRLLIANCSHGVIHVLRPIA